MKMTYCRLGVSFPPSHLEFPAIQMKEKSGHQSSTTDSASETGASGVDSDSSFSPSMSNQIVGSDRRIVEFALKYFFPPAIDRQVLYSTNVSGSSPRNLVFSIDATLCSSKNDLEL
jgi:hypothetical protein